jgi:hypothetical protein
MEKETLEEAADRHIYGDKRKNFIRGAEWQAERMYSEEELLQALSLGFTSTDETWEQCVAFAKEQFKKK